MACACNCVAYHNVKCQRMNWKYHKHECKELTNDMVPLKQLYDGGIKAVVIADAGGSQTVALAYQKQL